MLQAAMQSHKILSPSQTQYKTAPSWSDTNTKIKTNDQNYRSQSQLLGTRSTETSIIGISRCPQTPQSYRAVRVSPVNTVTASAQTDQGSDSNRKGPSSQPLASQPSSSALASVSAFINKSYTTDDRKSVTTSTTTTTGKTTTSKVRKNRKHNRSSSPNLTSLLSTSEGNTNYTAIDSRRQPTKSSTTTSTTLEYAHYRSSSTNTKLSARTKNNIAGEDKLRLKTSQKSKSVPATTTTTDRFASPSTLLATQRSFLPNLASRNDNSDFSTTTTLPASTSVHTNTKISSCLSPENQVYSTESRAQKESFHSSIEPFAGGKRFNQVPTSEQVDAACEAVLFDSNSFLSHAEPCIASRNSPELYHTIAAPVNGSTIYHPTSESSSSRVLKCPISGSNAITTTTSALTTALRLISNSGSQSPLTGDTTTASTIPSSSSSLDTYHDTLSTSGPSLSPPSICSSPQPRTPTDHLFTFSTAMPSGTSPIDIATPSRNSSSSPSSQGTKIGQYLGAEDSRTSAMMSGGGLDPNMGRGRESSFAGAKPISMNNPNRGQDPRMRRESLAGSMMNGMSWGGVSVGSWIRDDIIMGTSPFPYQSPSFHSSSYLPKLEANFMKDFSCCGKTLPSLHDLLQHYEECHAQQTPQSMRQASIAQQARESQQPNSKAAIAAQAQAQVQQQAQRQQMQQQMGRPQSGAGMKIPQSGGASALTGGINQMRQEQRNSNPTTPTQAKAQVADVDMDDVEDMEMDDPVGPMDPVDAPVTNNQPKTTLSGFGQRPALNLTNTNGMVHQGLRTSQPSTPATSGFGFNNPTVSSVNTPTLTTNTMQSTGTFSPDASAPGTPAELEDDYSNLIGMNNMTLGNLNMNMANLNSFNMLGLGNDLGVDLCIDEPAKRLYSPNGGFNNQQRQIQQQLANFNLNNTGFAGMQGMGSMSNEELMRRFQQQRLLQMQGLALNNQSNGFGEEHKPFKCPVIGCEKAYKNQNGLKYHKTHGHQTQQLHENGDGTFSIVNPETSAPYPGTLGMEKEKPYKCDVCGKRYKNLNGLKYHKQHSPPCNPELKLNGHLAAAGLGGLGNLSVNVAGLPGIGEEVL